MTDQDRKYRDVRIPIQLPVAVKDRRGEWPMLTEDISRRGLFLRTDCPKPLRQLVQLRATMLPDDQDIELLAVVVHSLGHAKAQARGGAPGMGMQFYGMSGARRDRWEAYIRRIEALHKVRAPGVPWMEAPPDAPNDPVRRRHPRYPATFKVRLRDVSKLYEFLTRDISVGGVFLLAEEPLPKGSELVLAIVHPSTGEEFSVSGEVVRRVEGPAQEAGMGVRFVDVDEDCVDRFREFIETGVPEDLIVTDDVQIIEEDDPDLAE